MTSQPVDWEREISAALEEVLGPPTPPNLAASIRYSILSPGKRFRPRLMQACASMLEVPAGHFVPFGVALEWIHGFTLIHDDLPCMDDDDFRRGAPSNHKVFGEALALLAGDALIPAAFEWASRSLDAGCTPDRWRQAHLCLARSSGPRGVIGGQAHEMILQESEPTQAASLEMLRTMHSLKTGALFEAALLVPAHLAGLSSGSQEFERIARFAHAFGLGFQTADDLEDAKEEWDPATGFPRTSILAHLAASEARRLASEALDQTSKELHSHWKDRARPLLEIADQLRHKLEASK